MTIPSNLSTTLPYPSFINLKSKQRVDLFELIKEEKIKMIYLDLGGTMVDIPENVRSAIVEDINIVCKQPIDVARFDQLVGDEWKRRYENAKEKRRIKSVKTKEDELKFWIEFFECVLEKVSCNDIHLAEKLAKIYRDPNSYAVYPYVQKVLKELNDQHIQVGIISNAFPSAREILKHTGLIQNFGKEQIILSYKVGSIKPEEAIYKIAIERAGVNSNEIVFIDDKKSFLDGAERLGINPVIVTTFLTKSIEQSRRSLVSEAVKAWEDVQKGKPGPLLLTFWGSKGMGKTTLLENIAHYLRENYQAAMTEILDFKKKSVEEVVTTLQTNLPKMSEKPFVILLDNIDELLRTTINGQSSFDDFERSTILPLIKQGNILILASSQVEINGWREEDVLKRQVNHHITAISAAQVAASVGGNGVETRKVYELTFGQPKVAWWLLEDPLMDKNEIAQKANGYFLEDIPEDARQIADIICLLPLFDAYLLKRILNSKADLKAEVQHLEILNQIKEYLDRGLVHWDDGSYRFTDSAVRRLLARKVLYENPTLFQTVQQIASDHTLAEARSPRFLDRHLVSAIYHLAQTLQGQSPESIGNECLQWMKSNQKLWSSAHWDKVLLAWDNGAGDAAVREEIIALIGIRYFEAIRRELEMFKQQQEEIK